MNHLMDLSDEKYKISAFKRRVNHPCTTSRSKVIYTFVPKITLLVSYIQMHHFHFGYSELKEPWKFGLTERTMRMPLTERTMKILLDLFGSKNWNASLLVWVFRGLLPIDFLLYWIEFKKNRLLTLRKKTMKMSLTERTMKMPLTERTMKILLDLSGSKNWNASLLFWVFRRLQYRLTFFFTE